MPIYEYRCVDCNHEIEALQKISDQALTDCPACGSSALKKKVSAAAFRLKGGGWYETDFKSGNKKNLVNADKPDAANKGAEGKAEGKKDTGSAPVKTSAGGASTTTTTTTSTSKE